MKGFYAFALLGVLTLAGRAGGAGEGAVAGTVTWGGQQVAPFQFDITTQPNDLKTCACTPDQKAKPSPRLAVDAESKGVAFTVVTLEGVPEDKAKAFPEREVFLDQNHCEFVPHILWVEANKPLKIRNSDNTLHNVHAKSEEGDAFNLSMPEKDQVITKKMRDPGVLSLVCDAGHGWMNGFVFVVDNPYIALTDAKGAFKLEGVPPGKYKLKFWHEGWKVTPALDPKTQKPASYSYSDPVTREAAVEVKEGGTTTADAVLLEDGFKK